MEDADTVSHEFPDQELLSSSNPESSEEQLDEGHLMWDGYDDASSSTSVDKDDTVSISGRVERNYDDPHSSCFHVPVEDQSVRFEEELGGVEGSKQGILGPVDVKEDGESFNFDDESIWLPPDPEDQENEMEITMANNNEDDDNEIGTGEKWDQSSLISIPSNTYSKSGRIKEERRRMMLEVMNGNFRALVGQLLTSEGIPLNSTAGKGWLDIVTCLSWEAAVMVKPDVNEGREMDPGCYVKVKCIGSCLPSQSQLINGLVFKKNSAHKHMPTRLENPRLLLIRGFLGEGANGLSSFNSLIGQEKDDLKPVTEMLELCHPNVVLVEKNVSRGIQESLLSKGITLVLDMKLPRMERLARCTGSQIYSSSYKNLYVKRCDLFHIEKVVEELEIGEAGKPSTKTLMFFEGCAKPLGCTVLSTTTTTKPFPILDGVGYMDSLFRMQILLKGATIVELKKIKRVTQYAVFAAYHLILETSFLVDEWATFPRSIPAPVPVGSPKIERTDETTSEIKEGNDLHSLENSHSGRSLEEFPKDVMIHDVASSLEDKLELADLLPDNQATLHETVRVEENGSDSIIFESYVPLILPKQLFSSLTSSLKKVVKEKFPVVSHSPYESVSSYFGFNNKETGTLDDASSPHSLTDKLLVPEVDAIGEIKEDKLNIGIHDSTNSVSGSPSTDASIKQQNTHNNYEVAQKHSSKPALDPQSILVLKSSRLISKLVTCESHLSRIKYYGNFDKSLGRFLREIMLKEAHSCSKCGQGLSSHVYWYTHQNGRLEVRLKQLPGHHHLPGQEEGKLWMWTRCLKCHKKNHVAKPTQRVEMSSAAHGLSFGKFLELSFANFSVSDRLSSCGHSLNRDCLRFYGLGTSVTMFSYSSVEIYDVQMPQPLIDFCGQNGKEWFEEKVKDVHEKGKMLFGEVKTSLQALEAEFLGNTLEKFHRLPAPVKEFNDLEEMLRKEISVFEATLQKSLSKSSQPGQAIPEILHLNYLTCELLLELYIWDQRLHYLGLSFRTKENTQEIENLIYVNLSENNDRNGAENRPDDHLLVNECAHLSDQSDQVPVLHERIGLEKVVQPSLQVENGIKDAHDLQFSSADVSIHPSQAESSSYSFKNSDLNAGASICTTENCSIEKVPSESNADVIKSIDDMSFQHAIDEGQLLSLSNDSVAPVSVEACQDNCLPVPVQQKAQGASAAYGMKSASIAMATESGSNGTENALLTSLAEKSSSRMCFDEHSQSRSFESPERWVWLPFSGSRKAFKEDFRGGFSPTFDFIKHYAPLCLTTARKLMMEEGTRLHIPVGVEGNIVSVYEDEYTSIIASALALLNDKSKPMKIAVEGNHADGERVPSTLSKGDGMLLQSWSSSVSIDAPERHSDGNSSSEDSTSGYENQLSLNPLLHSKDLHPEIFLDDRNSTAKYSVVCVYAEQFCALRKRCCPAELDYIASLSRCRKWNAQGGKSKALFAKTLDDRFIVKQVKKTEFDSFLKFGAEYFKYISQSLRSRNQTCLAKILGIYQVSIRHSKGSKDLRMEVMVIENVLHGRNISRKYDLKGVGHARYQGDAKESERVLLDADISEAICTSPLFVGKKAKHLLQRAIWNDTAFLNSINVMDYSLLVGVDNQRHELVFGIIDYLRQYTWDKHLESWVKASLGSKSSPPTILSPKDYKKRFRKAMSGYFLIVPDPWCTEQVLGSCNDATDDSSN